MKFRIRDGYSLFRSMDDAVAFQCAGSRSGVVPRARAGDVVELSDEEFRNNAIAGTLGRFDAADTEAAELFARLGVKPESRSVGSYPPATSTSISTEETHVSRPARVWERL